jgi:hypothetical protein
MGFGAGGKQQHRRARAPWAFDHLVPPGRIFLAGDDTVTEHPGDKVFGKGCHRDPVRSTHSFTAFRWGHKWVVLAVLVRFPFTRRLWALPLLVALYRSPQDNQQAGRRHKTPARLLRLSGDDKGDVHEERLPDSKDELRVPCRRKASPLASVGAVISASLLEGKLHREPPSWQ